MVRPLKCLVHGCVLVRSEQNFIIYNEDAKRDFGKFQGQMDCITVINNDAQSSSSMTGSSQGTDRGGSSGNSKDDDGDGVPYSSDKCTHNSNPRCFKEGDTSTLLLLLLHNNNTNNSSRKIS